ncbi:hypothetical protein TSUD_27940 [Trifolium subterraneum]|uniref:Uncharacterized protein n=1 Tax=Trifolium subterraneum TaxID=3900 RepID=A0A2Z6P503_TRISU|nr:hypothetical protein TSUD_27940 [Trifolium subterraneum]
MSYHPRSLSWIVVLVGALAIFLIYASFVLVSAPIGATVNGYFYGIGSSSEKLDLSVSHTHDASIDTHTNKTLDLDDNKPISSTGTSDSNIEQTDTTLNSQIDNSKSNYVKLPTREDVNETSDVRVSNSPEPVTSIGDKLDAANTRLPAQENSQVDSTSSATVPVEIGAGSSNSTGSIKTDEPPAAVSINQSSAVFKTSNETSATSDNSASTTVPKSVEKPDNASNAGSVHSGYSCNLFTYTSLF